MNIKTKNMALASGLQTLVNQEKLFVPYVVDQTNSIPFIGDFFSICGIII